MLVYSDKRVYKAPFTVAHGTRTRGPPDANARWAGVVGTTWNLYTYGDTDPTASQRTAAKDAITKVVRVLHPHRTAPTRSTMDRSRRGAKHEDLGAQSWRGYVRDIASASHHFSKAKRYFPAGLDVGPGLVEALGKLITIASREHHKAITPSQVPEYRRRDEGEGPASLLSHLDLSFPTKVVEDRHAKSVLQVGRRRCTEVWTFGAEGYSHLLGACLSYAGDHRAVSRLPQVCQEFNELMRSVPVPADLLQLRELEYKVGSSWMGLLGRWRAASPDELEKSVPTETLYPSWCLYLARRMVVAKDFVRFRHMLREIAVGQLAKDRAIAEEKAVRKMAAAIASLRLPPGREEDAARWRLSLQHGTEKEAACLTYHESLRGLAKMATQATIKVTCTCGT